jgi:hypothetical protein
METELVASRNAVLALQAEVLTRLNTNNATNQHLHFLVRPHTSSHTGTHTRRPPLSQVLSLLVGSLGKVNVVKPGLTPREFLDRWRDAKKNDTLKSLCQKVACEKDAVHGYDEKQYSMMAVLSSSESLYPFFVRPLYLKLKTCSRLV